MTEQITLLSETIKRKINIHIGGRTVRFVNGDELEGWIKQAEALENGLREAVKGLEEVRDCADLSRHDVANRHLARLGKLTI